MKKNPISVIITLLCMLILFVGCSKTVGHISYFEDFVYQDGEETFDITFMSGYMSFDDWDDPYMAYQPIIPDREVAIEVATKILEREFDGLLQPEGVYVPSIVYYDEVDEYWIVTFVDKETLKAPVAGGGLNVAIQKSDGKVLGIFIGE